MARRIGSRREFQVVLEGPIFDPRWPKTWERNVQDLMDAVAAEGQRYARSELEARIASIPNWTGHTRGRIVGRTKSRAGKRWRVTAVISANTDGMSARGAIRTKAAAAQLERRFHMFRRTATAMRRARAVLHANLTKGLST